MITDTHTEKMTLDEYQKLVDRCARERSDFKIANSSPEHARILIAKLFETARREVNLITGKLTDTTASGEQIYGWPNVVQNAKKFLSQPEARLNIIALGSIDCGEQNTLIKSVVNDHDFRGEFRIYIADDAVKSFKQDHFMVTDSLAYRYETNDDHTVAVANFGDAKTAKNLRELFGVYTEYLGRQDGALTQYKKEPPTA